MTWGLLHLKTFSTNIQEVPQVQSLEELFFPADFA